MLKRSLSILLAFTLLLSCLAMAACSENQSSDNGNNQGEGDRVTRPDETSSEDTSIFDARNAVDDELPDVKYNGREFRIIARDRDDFKKEVGVELDQNEEVVSKAIFDRNKTIEDRFDVKLVAQHVTSPVVDVQRALKAGLDSYDLLLDHVRDTCQAVINGGFYAIDELEYVNLDKPWYMKSANDNISVKGKSYVLAGDMCLSIYRFTYCMLFNKKMLANHPEMEDLYTVVKEGRWTIDYQNELIKNLYQDNGDGVRDKNDTYGFTSNYMSAAVTYQYCLDNPIMIMDADGVPQLNFNTPRMVNIAQKVYELMIENPGSWCGDWNAGAGDIFKKGNALLYNALVGDAAGMRDVEFDFGIIPYPKYDETQTNYYTMVDGAHSIMAVPTTADAEFVSVILEALNAESYKKVIPAFYETDLKIKGARGDETAAEILDMISQGIVFDFGYVYGPLGTLLSNVIASGKGNFASMYDKNEKSAIKQYDKVIEKYLSIAE